jgi:hypothetical protein
MTEVQVLAEVRKKFFLFTTVSRLALVPTQPPIQWALGALSLGINLPEHEGALTLIW